MAKRYSLAGQLAAVTTTPGKTIVSVVGVSLTRFAIYDAMFGADATSPADNSLRFRLRRFSVAPTVTAQQGTAVDSGDAASQLTSGTAGCGVNASAEGTYTAGTELLDVPLNQRATFRWVAFPDGEFRAPASTNGIGLVCFAASYVGVATGNVMWQE